MMSKMGMGKPQYYKFHRVFSTKKHLNGTVLQNKWGEKAGAYIYEVVLDNGEKIWATDWTLASEKPIEWYVGKHCYHVELKQDCEVIDIKGFNSVYMDWVLEVRLDDGQVVRTPQMNLVRRKIKKEDNG